MKRLMKILDKVASNEIKVGLLDESWQQLTLALLQFETLNAQSLGVKKDPAQIVAQTKSDEDLNTCAAKAYLLMLRVKKEARLLQQTIGFVGDMLARTRLHLAVGSGQNPGYAVKSIRLNRTTAPPLCILRQISELLGDVETLNIVSIKKADAVMALCVGLSSNLLRKIKHCRKAAITKKGTLKPSTVRPASPRRFVSK